MIQGVEFMMKKWVAGGLPRTMTFTTFKESQSESTFQTHRFHRLIVDFVCSVDPDSKRARTDPKQGAEGGHTSLP